MIRRSAYICGNNQKKETTMLNNELKKTATMEGRSVDMKVIATGDIHEAYDIYISVSAYSDKVRVVDGKSNRLNRTMFVRLIYWKTTHKKIVFGTLSVLEDGGFNSAIVQEFEKISTPVEIKDYWKKSFEKYVVVEMGKFLHTERGFDALDYMWRMEDPQNIRPDSDINHVLVYTLPIASWELTRRNSCIQGEEAPGLDHKCYDGPHGFVRSDKADDFDIPPVTSFPVSELVV